MARRLLHFKTQSWQGQKRACGSLESYLEPHQYLESKRGQSHTMMFKSCRSFGINEFDPCPQRILFHPRRCHKTLQYTLSTGTSQPVSLLENSFLRSQCVTLFFRMLVIDGSIQTGRSSFSHGSHWSIIPTNHGVIAWGLRVFDPKLVDRIASLVGPASD